MGALTTRYRSLWVLALGLPVLGGVAALVIELLIKPHHACTTGNPSHGLRYFVIYLVLALAPATIVGAVGWRSKRGGEDTVGPIVAAGCLSVLLVFVGLLAGWHGSGCIT